MPYVVKKETKTYTKSSPDEPGVQVITTETTETMDDGSTLTTVKTIKKGAGLDTFHKDTRDALDDIRHRGRHRSSSSTSSEGEKKHGHGHRDRHRSRSSSPEKKKGGLFSRLRKHSKSRSPSPKATIKSKKESKSSHRHRSSSSSSSDDDDQFESDCIQAHNEYRKKHNVKPLEYSRKLTKKAKAWAQQLARDDKMSHRDDSSDGENIYCKWSSNPKHKVKGNEAVDSWYAEIKDHDFSQEPTPGILKSGHFSQVVWLSTRNVGVGSARAKSGRVYVVANYSPAGNFLGDYCDNVPPIGGFPVGHKPKRETTRVEKKSKHRSASSASSEDGSDEDNFAEECLKAHNEYRKKHGVSALKLNKKLCKHSQEWAKIIAKKDVMEHRPDNKYGENIFCVWSDDPTFEVRGREAVDSWYNEIKDHSFNCEPQSGAIKSGHFTQLIWKRSKELGIGKARSKSGKIMVVANYDPPGNFIGEFVKNVPRSQ